MKDLYVLGKNASYSADSEVTGLNNNIIVCGGTGCGKTMSIVEPTLMATFDSSLVITVSKRRLIDKYTPIFRKAGYDVKVLDFADPENSEIAYDPLLQINSYGDIDDIAGSIALYDFESKDPYWEHAAKNMLCAEIAAVLMRETAPTFADVLKLHTTVASQDKANEKIFNDIAQKYPEGCYASTRWADFEDLAHRTYGCVYSTLSASFGRFFTEESKKMMARGSNLDFRSVADKKTVLFVYVSSANAAHYALANMFYGQLLKALIEYGEELPNGELPVPVRFIFDDFAVGNRIPDFAVKISIFRAMGISVMILIQSETQLRGMYGYNDAVTIINNCDTYVYMGGNDTDTCSEIGRRMGKPLHEILCMPLNREIIFRRGSEPMITERCDTVFAASSAKKNPSTGEYSRTNNVKGISPEDGKANIYRELARRSVAL
ncbi:MAG: type IV secretory system conjugative DNA transfer family protein [Abditibacteriota bacterium]|nr:type IV secretory system conjugative DNA transfer family protein [Abditibacteriota bacterium]